MPAWIQLSRALETLISILYDYTKNIYIYHYTKNSYYTNNENVKLILIELLKKKW